MVVLNSLRSDVLDIGSILELIFVNVALGKAFFLLAAASFTPLARKEIFTEIFEKLQTCQ